MKMNKQMPLIALCLGFFMVIIDVMIVNIALPNIAKDLHSGVSGLQWIVAGYALTFACLLLSAGSLGDKVGVKKVFLWGLILFVLTSLGCGLAWTLSVLIVFRLLQGMAAALLVPTSLALINASYESKEERAKAIGIWASIGGVASVAAPILGALLTAGFGWRAVFFVNVPIGLLAVLLVIRHVPNPVGGGKNSFDIAGQLFGIISIAALAFAFIEAGNISWFSVLVISAFSIFLLSFVIFLLIEHHTVSPMFPLHFFRSKTFSTVIGIGMILNMSVYGELFVLSLYFQQIREYSAIMTGFALLPFLGLAIVASYLGGKMVSVIGSRLPMAIGLIMGAIGFFALLIIREHTPSYWVLILPLALVGFGAPLTMPAATIAAINAAPEGRAGIASGAFNASRQIGSLMGVAIFGTIVSTSTSFISGMHGTLIIGGTIYLLGCIASLIWINKNHE
jgi:MFS transporter, DHA2 family, methylenomycin A resistance protein